MKSYQIAVLPGDGIGPEVVDVALDVLHAVGEQSNIHFEITQKLIGGCAYEKFNNPLPQNT